MQTDIESFLRVLDPADNSTGGGTASAVAGAMAAALVAMVGRLSLGKPGMAAQPFYREIIAEAESLSRRLFSGGREDAEAFDAVMSAVRMPKATDEQKSARSASMAAAMLKATEIPLANAEGCGRVLALCRQLQGRSNPNAASDLESAGHLALAGLKGCLANVAINLPGIKDPDQADRIKARADALQKLA